ncbi:MAG: DUF389 domain-containing protein [Gemmatimonadaceae bacterium]
MTTSRRPILALARQVVSLRAETDYEATAAQVREATELRSGGVWALAFAILIASVGLNVNSTAVIIGAMLISPLMGPIVGAGLALGTDDLELLRVSVRNLILSTFIALAASTLYFALSPLADAQSELLARTHPTLYDVLIALFGGGAGIVAVSRKANKSTVVPGVAIATALMPPLCTAGFGLAHGEWSIFGGALNLFFINALFICVATLSFVRLMHFERARAVDQRQTARMHWIVAALTIALALPSVYTAWISVQEARFRTAARRFVAEELTFPSRSMLNVTLHYGRDSSTIEAVVIGDPLPRATTDSLTRRLASYNLGRTRLILRQPFAQQLSAPQISEMLREALQQRGDARVDPAPTATATAADGQVQAMQSEIERLRAQELPVQAVTTELAALYPSLESLSIGPRAARVDTVADSAAVPTMGTLRELDAVARWRGLPSTSERVRIRAWLRARLRTDSVHVTHVPASGSTP